MSDSKSPSELVAELAEAVRSLPPDEVAAELRALRAEVAKLREEKAAPAHHCHGACCHACAGHPHCNFGHCWCWTWHTYGTVTYPLTVTTTPGTVTYPNTWTSTATTAGPGFSGSYLVNTAGTNTLSIGTSN